MVEIIKGFMGKECLIYTMTSQITGTIRDMADGWVLVDNGKQTEAINLDYITRIREYPRKKNGKKASFIVD